MENIARQVINLKTQLDEMKAAYSQARAEMFNALSNAHQDNFEIDGFRLSRAKPHTIKTYSRESVTNGLRSVLELSDEQILDVLVASQNESEVFGDIVVRKLKSAE